MQQLASFLSGIWQSGRGRERTITHAISGKRYIKSPAKGWIWRPRAVTPLNTAEKRSAQ